MLCFSHMLHTESKGMLNFWICKKNNPAYGRQRISRPMRIVASIPKTILLKRQNSSKIKLFLRCDFTPFLRKSIQIWDHFFQLVFPNDSENITSLDIGLREVGAKRRLNGVNKGKQRKKTIFAAAILDHFWAKFFKSETIFFHNFSPRILNL